MKRMTFTSITLAIMAIVIAFAISPSTVAVSLQEPDIVVTTAAELQGALSPTNAGARILVRAGVYDVSQALTVPDRATLVGEGVMSFDESGLPSGFEPSGRTVVRATAAVVGDVLTLGDGAALRGLVIEDVAGRVVAGNAVAVVSRAAGDFLSARIEECEIITPSPAPAGLGRGLVIMTLNPDVQPPHEGAVLRVRMTRSIVRSPGAANGIFAINLASHGQIILDVESNVVGGGINSAGGAGRPTSATTGAGVIIKSSHNLYRSDSLVPTAIGWFLFGGSDSPSAASQASTFNTLQIHSIDDTLAGFTNGIFAIGGRRIWALSEPISSNRVELNLHGTLLQTTTADLRLVGANTQLVGVSTGDYNIAHVLIDQATGSGVRANRYVHSAIPALGNPGIGNRLEIVGNANAFVQTNQDFLPHPPAEFFTGGQ